MNVILRIVVSTKMNRSPYNRQRIITNLNHLNNLLQISMPNRCPTHLPIGTPARSATIIILCLWLCASVQ